MHLDVVGHFIRGKIIGVLSKGIFYFFGYELQAGDDIKNKASHGYYEIAHAKDITQWQGHDIEEDEFFYKDRIGKWDGGILDPFTSSAYFRKGLQLCIEDDELVAADATRAIELHYPVQHHTSQLIGDMLLVIDLVGKDRIVIEQLDTGGVIA